MGDASSLEILLDTPNVQKGVRPQVRAILNDSFVSKERGKGYVTERVKEFIREKYNSLVAERSLKDKVVSGLKKMVPRALVGAGLGYVAGGTEGAAVGATYASLLLPEAIPHTILGLANRVRQSSGEATSFKEAPLQQQLVTTAKVVKKELNRKLKSYEQPGRALFDFVKANIINFGLIAGVYTASGAPELLGQYTQTPVTDHPVLFGLALGAVMGAGKYVKQLNQTRILRNDLKIGLDKAIFDDRPEKGKVASIEPGPFSAYADKNMYLSTVNDEGILETPIAVYERDDGKRVVLIGAQHIGSLEYYQALQEALDNCEEVLVEGTGKRNGKPTVMQKLSGGGMLLSIISKMMHKVPERIGLISQREGIDYNGNRQWENVDVDTAELITKLNTGRSFTHGLKKQAKMYAAAVALLAKTYLWDSLVYGPRTAFSRKPNEKAWRFEADTDIGIMSDRNHTVEDRLVEWSEGPGKEMGVFYGSEHLKMFHFRLTKDLGYRMQEAYLVEAL